MNIQKKYMDKVLKIMELALIKTFPGKRDIFVKFSAHIGTLSVSIYKDGWELKKEADFKNDHIYLDDESILYKEHEEMLEKELDNVIKIIEEL